MRNDKKDFCLSTRTFERVRDAVLAVARREHRTQSEVVHLLLCEHYGLDPDTGKPCTPADDGDHPGSSASA